MVMVKVIRGQWIGPCCDNMCIALAEMGRKKSETRDIKLLEQKRERTYSNVFSAHLKVYLPSLDMH